MVEHFLFPNFEGNLKRCRGVGLIAKIPPRESLFWTFELPKHLAEPRCYAVGTPRSPTEAAPALR